MTSIEGKELCYKTLIQFLNEKMDPYYTVKNALKIALKENLGEISEGKNDNISRKYKTILQHIFLKHRKVIGNDENSCFYSANPFIEQLCILLEISYLSPIFLCNTLSDYKTVVLEVEDKIITFNKISEKGKKNKTLTLIYFLSNPNTGNIENLFNYINFLADTNSLKTSLYYPLFDHLSRFDKLKKLAQILKNEKENSDNKIAMEVLNSKENSLTEPY